MRVIEGVAVALVALLLLLVAFFVRRAILARSGGTVELGLRLSTMVPGRGWSAGVGRFVGDELRWYRMFSFAVRPRRVLSRRLIAVEERRTPGGAERLVLPKDWVIVRCVTQDAEVEIAMAKPALTGFLSWVEAAPPGGEVSDSRRSRTS